MTYKLLFCSKRNTASVVVTCEVVGTLNHYEMVKKKLELCTLRGNGDVKFFISISSTISSARGMSHLVKLLLPYICHMLSCSLYILYCNDIFHFG